MYDVCVIGAGPAGISSAVYAASRGMKTVVLEQKAIGGLLGSVSTVTHYAGILPNETGASFSARLKEQAEGAGVELVMEKVVKAEFSVYSTNGYESKTPYEIMKEIEGMARLMKEHPEAFPEGNAPMLTEMFKIFT